MSVTLDIRRKGFGDHIVLRDVTFDVADGEIVAVMGASGCGKTTLLSIIAGLEQADEGRIECGAGVVAMVFQEPRLLPWLTARGNVELVIGGHVDKAEITRYWLDRVGLQDAAGVYPRALSLGMARRVAVARALAVEPGLLLLDEPFASLDDATADHLRSVVLSEARCRRITTLLATHDIRDVVAVADRLVALRGNPASVAADIPITISDAMRHDRAALSLWTERLRRGIALADPAASRREA